MRSHKPSISISLNSLWVISVPSQLSHFLVDFSWHFKVLFYLLYFCAWRSFPVCGWGCWQSSLSHQFPSLSLQGDKSLLKASGWLMLFYFQPSSWEKKEYGEVHGACLQWWLMTIRPLLLSGELVAEPQTCGHCQEEFLTPLLGAPPPPLPSH